MSRMFWLRFTWGKARHLARLNWFCYKIKNMPRKKKPSESIRFVPGSSNIKAGEVSELRPKDEDSRVLCSQWILSVNENWPLNARSNSHGLTSVALFKFKFQSSHPFCEGKSPPYDHIHSFWMRKKKNIVIHFNVQCFKIFSWCIFQVKNGAIFNSQF